MFSNGEHWIAVSLPILQAVATAEKGPKDGPDRDVHGAAVAAAHSVGLEGQDMVVEFAQLYNADYVRANLGATRGGGDLDFVIVEGLTEKGLRATGVWPSEMKAAEAFAKAIEQAISTAPPDERKRLKQLLESVYDAPGVGAILLQAAQWGFGG